jgi:hypothetical protein
VRAVVGVAEVVVARRVLILRREGHRRDDQADAVRLHALGLDDGVFVDDLPVGPALLAPIDTDRPLQHIRRAGQAQPVLADDLAHPAAHFLVPLPLAFERLAHAALGLAVDQVDPHPLRLQESLDAVDRLDEVVELEPDAKEDRPGAVPLEVAARSGQHRLGRQLLDLAVGEADDRPLAVIELLRAVDADDVRHRLLDRPPLVLEVVPQDPMGAGILGPQRQHLGDPHVEARSLLARRVDHADRFGFQQTVLPVLLRAGGAVIGGHLVPADVERRQLIAFVAEAEVARPLHERGPAVHP